MVECGWACLIREVGFETLGVQKWARWVSLMLLMSFSLCRYFKYLPGSISLADGFVSICFTIMCVDIWMLSTPQ